MWEKLVERRNAYVERLNKIYAKNLDNATIERIVGVAKFVGPNQVEIQGTGRQVSRPRPHRRRREADHARHPGD